MIYLPLLIALLVVSTLGVSTLLGTRAPVTVLERTSARQGHGGGAAAAAEQALGQP